MAENRDLTSIPRKCDVVVVGGGPSGTFAASSLAERGYDVVLFDKQKHPRYHVGESLLPDFWKHTDAIGVSDRIVEEGFVNKAGGIVSWCGQIKALGFKDFGYDKPALHIERDAFDHILLEDAHEKGVQVFEEVAVVRADLGDTVTSTVRPAGGNGSYAVESPFIVDATGQNALLGRQLGIRSVDRSFRYMSVWGYFKDSKYFDFEGNPHNADEYATAHPTTFVASLDDAGAGWLWHIPLRESTSVGLVVPLDVAKQVKQEDGAWETYFLRTCREVPYVRDLLAEAEFIEGSLHVINDYSFRSSQVAGPGFFLTGDAAGFVDPIFSVGVVMAMYSGRAAAWAIDESFRRPSSAEAHRNLFSHQLEGRIEIARSLALPTNRSPGDRVSDLAKTAVKLERGEVQQLMLAASSLTTRSRNFLEMVEADEDVPEFEDERVKVLTDLTV